VLREASQRWKENEEVNAEKFFVQLAQKDVRSSWRTAQQNLAAGRDLTDEIRGWWLFRASIAGILDQQEVEAGGEDYVSKYLGTTHEYRDYVVMLSYWALRKEGRDREAANLLERRWGEIQGEGARPDYSWEKRLASGDIGVWREMLVGYYLGEVDKAKIFGSLTDAATFSRSDLAKLELPLSGMRCEAYFYDALLQSVTGEPGTRLGRYEASLLKVLDSGHRGFFEYQMAAYLLDQLKRTAN
jgi:hypothetical protein